MPTKLAQIVAYVSPAVKKRIQKEVEKASKRTTVSAFIDEVLRRHFEKSPSN